MEGIEFAIRTGTDENWIPLRLDYYNGPTSSQTVIRGYTVTAMRHTADSVTLNVSICGNLLRNVRIVQFRWVGSIGISVPEYLDVWALSNVSASVITNNSNQPRVLFNDSFGSETLK